MMSPTQRALAELKRRGWPAGVVEQTIPKMFIKRDLFGVLDIVAIVPPTESPGYILGIQVTSGPNHAARIAKIAAEPRATKWLEAGGRIEVWSYSKRGARGKRKVWTLRVESVDLGLAVVNHWFEPQAMGTRWLDCSGQLQETALDRLAKAAVVVADILDAGERDPRWAESSELEAAAIDYGRAVRTVMTTAGLKHLAITVPMSRGTFPTDSDPGNEEKR